MVLENGKWLRIVRIGGGTEDFHSGGFEIDEFTFSVFDRRGEPEEDAASSEIRSGCVFDSSGTPLEGKVETQDLSRLFLAALRKNSEV